MAFVASRGPRLSAGSMPSLVLPPPTISAGAAPNDAFARLGIERPEMGEDERRRIEDLAGISELRGSLGRELGRLPDDQRAAVRLRVVDELSYAEVAAQMEITPEAARTRVSRGLRTLARGLTPTKEALDAH